MSFELWRRGSVWFVGDGSLTLGPYPSQDQAQASVKRHNELRRVYELDAVQLIERQAACLAGRPVDDRRLVRKGDGA